MAQRGAQALNEALHEVFERRGDVYLLGEDVLDPYGGAFKVTRGLSERYPDRVLTTPVSEAALFGVAAGMALRGLRPVLEVMFGDFLALGFDQLVNGISKFREMYDGQVNVPLVIRTPMGGRRGYGPTHSQSLEKLLLGVPNLTVVAGSELHDLGGLLVDAIEDDAPVVFVENKLLYGRMLRRPVDGYVDEFRCSEAPGRYPAVSLSANDFGPAAATIATYGGMAPIVLEAAAELVLERELFCEVVVKQRFELAHVMRVTVPQEQIDEARMESGLSTRAIPRLEEAAADGLVGHSCLLEQKPHDEGDVLAPSIEPVDGDA